MSLLFRLQTEASKHEIGDPLEKLLNEAIDRIKGLEEELQDASERMDDFDLGGEESVITDSDLNQIEKLSICGQKEPARELVLQIVSEAIGRNL